MIVLTHFNGNRMAINSELIEKVEASPDTVILMTTGTHYLVRESLDDVVSAAVEARARVAALANQLSAQPHTARLKLVRDEDPDGREAGEH